MSTAEPTIFERIVASDDSSVSFKVETSMLEIYNERVRDLFNPTNAPPTDARLESQKYLKAIYKQQESGAAGGAAITTDDDDHDYRGRHDYHDGGHCPPGQAKKGRC